MVATENNITYILLYYYGCTTLDEKFSVRNDIIAQITAIVIIHIHSRTERCSTIL